MQTLIYNAMLVLPEKLIFGGWLLIEDERIADFGEDATCPDPASIESAIDASTHFLMPGLIDLHSDAIEKLVEPRPNVFFDLNLALIEADWRLAGCGITTEFHAVSLDDNEFGVRTDSFVRDIAQATRAAQGHLLVRHKIHVRLELSSQRGFNMLSDLITSGEDQPGMVSLMDHSPGQGQYTTEEAYREYMMRTTSKSEAEVDATLALKRSQVLEIPKRIEQVTILARQAGLAIATHDDDTAEKVEQWPSMGVTMSEFPTTIEAARRAHELGLAVCMGAPNALRGKSSGGNLSALEALQAGVANVLCTDYYPSALLTTAFKLATQDMLSLPFAIQMVTLNPATAVGLGESYGSIETGKIADLILVKLSNLGFPLVQQVFVGGQQRIARY